MPKTETYDYVCADCEFVSRGHATKKAAAARGAEHQTEHETGEPMRELTEKES